VRNIHFPNGARARLVEASDEASPQELLADLEVSRPGAVIAVVGAADSLDPRVVPWLTQLFSRGLGMAANRTGALLVDGGTDSGAMAVLGQALADQVPRPRLLGVAPRQRVTYPGAPSGAGELAALEPNHDYFVLAPAADWGGETALLFGLVDELAVAIPTVCVLVGGGEVARAEILRVVRRRWPLFVVAGSGGLADELARTLAGRKADPGTGVADPVMAEIVADGDIELVALESEPASFGGLLMRHLQPDPSLELAWEQFAVLDDNAIRRQNEFRRTQALILTLGVLGTVLAVTQATLEADDLFRNQWGRDLLRYVIIVIPIALAGMLTAAARFSAGSKWVVLRGSAEAVKREIFRYRARVGVYADAGDAGMARQARLAERVSTISAGVMKTEVNLAAFRPYKGVVPPPRSVGSGDDAFSVLTPEQYLKVRLRDQAGWYHGKVVREERKLRRLRWATIAIGGLGTFLAAIGFELWIAVTTSMVAAVTAYLEYMQVESALLHYNQAASDLETIRRWWVSLRPEGKTERVNIDRLVDQAERVMRSESAGWIQEMHDAMAELRRQQDAADAKQDGHDRPGPESGAHESPTSPERSSSRRATPPL